MNETINSFWFFSEHKDWWRSALFFQHLHYLNNQAIHVFILCRGCTDRFGLLEKINPDSPVSSHVWTRIYISFCELNWFSETSFCFRLNFFSKKRDSVTCVSCDCHLFMFETLGVSKSCGRCELDYFRLSGLWTAERAGGGQKQLQGAEGGPAGQTEWQKQWGETLERQTKWQVKVRTWAQSKKRIIWDRPHV